MIRFLLPLLLFLSPIIPQGLFQTGGIEDLNVLFKAGNAKEIAQNFSSTVELSIVDSDDVYSKAQAEQILRDFFSKNSPKNSKIIHHINTNPTMRFGILNLTTAKGIFRISITSKKVNQSFLITELRIEQEK